MATRSPTYTLSPLLKRAIIWLKNWASDILKRNLLFIAALLMSTFLMKRVFSICVCSITEATSNLSLAEKWAVLQILTGKLDGREATLLAQLRQPLQTGWR